MKSIRALVAGKLGFAERLDPEEGQPFFLDLMKKTLEAAGDPDFEFLERAKTGFPLGVLEQLPMTPMIFEEQTKWALEGELWEEAVWQKDNYTFAKGPQAIQVSGVGMGVLGL